MPVQWLAPVLLLQTASLAPGQELRTRNVVLVTVDGLRPQELFSGADPLLLESDAVPADAAAEVRQRFWRESPRERREALLPFFWKTLARDGIVLGDRSAGSVVSIANPHRLSYPGYAEILTGRVVSEIDGNVALQNPVETVLEVAKRDLSLDRTEVAAFTSWNHFPYIVESRPGTVFVNAGYAAIEEGAASPEMKFWGDLQYRMLTPWDSVRHNAVTEALALAFLHEYRPRLLFLAFDETDEWAHGRRYDRTLQAIQLVDAILERLWSTLQSLDGYRGQTTLVVTTDHGRGVTREDWSSHGNNVPRSEETWIAFLGPDTVPLDSSEVHAPLFARQVAPTVLALLGLDPNKLGRDASEPVELAYRTR